LSTDVKNLELMLVLMGNDRLRSKHVGFQASRRVTYKVLDIIKTDTMEVH